MKDEELTAALKIAHALVTNIECHYIDDEARDRVLAALDHVLDPENGTIAAKQGGWTIARGCANVIQALSTECDLLKLRVAELERELELTKESL